MKARYHISDHPDGHGFLTCAGHLLIYLDTENVGEDGCWVRSITDIGAECLTCAGATLERERREYEALSPYERGAYDYVGQQGGTHVACLEAATSL